MKVTIITAVFNREKTIGRAIKSVLSQDYHNIEYVVIDGFSQDGTLGVINEFGESISTLISEPDKGIYDALNKGLSYATGDIIGFLHSDDFLSNEMVISDMVKAFVENEKIDLVFGDLSFFAENDLGKVIRNYKSNFFRPWMMRFALQPAHPTVYAKSSVYKNVGNFNTSYKISADFDWLLRSLIIAKLPYYYNNKMMVKMQKGGASTGGFKSMFKHNKEDLQILKSHGILSGWPFVIAKYFYKVFQLRL